MDDQQVYDSESGKMRNLTQGDRFDARYQLRSFDGVEADKRASTWMSEKSTEGYHFLSMSTVGYSGAGKAIFILMARREIRYDGA